MLFGCDHATKIAAKTVLEDAAPVQLAPGVIELRYVPNPDIAFSALQRFGVPHSPKMLVALATMAIVVLAALAIAATRRRRAPEASPLGERDARAEFVSRAGFAFIFSGAFGNLVDRIVRGYVVDFIHVWRWPVFNVADIAVVVGGLLLLVARFLRTRSTSAAGPIE